MRRFLMALLAVAASLLVVGLFAAALGRSPLALLATLVRGSLGSPWAISESLVKSVPLLLTALSVLVAFRAGVWNIGAEGQFIVGGLAAFLATRGLDVPILSPAVGLLAGVAGGAAWASIAAWLKLRRNAPEVLTTILLNFVAIHLLGWAVNGPLQERSAQYPQSEPLSPAATLPALGSLRVHAGLAVALAAAVAVWFLLYRTAAGLRLRAVGFNPDAARFAGVNVRLEMTRAMLVSGALAGLAGSVELEAVTRRLFERFATGHGYSGIAVALVAQLHPLGAIASALFFGAFATGAGELQRGGEISASVAVLLQGIVILALLLFASPRLTMRFGGLRRLLPRKDGGA